MSDYSAVQQALATGVAPAMLCTTCPWDRNCLTPPVTTSQEVEAALKDAEQADRAQMETALRAGQAMPAPRATLLAIAVLGGKDTAAQVCPVLALRLRSSGGRRVADEIRNIMQNMGDDL